jgi:uncharacterized repeat protein (TIGR01451 family)
MSPVLFAMLAIAAPSAYAAPDVPAPHWSLVSVAQPSNFSSTVSANSPASDRFTIVARNVGGISSSGPVTITDQLPAGVSLLEGTVSGVNTSTGENLECTSVPVQCVATGVVGSGETIVMHVPVKTEPSASGTLTNTATVASEGADAESAVSETPVTSIRLPFAVRQFEFAARTSGGLEDAQAGDHPENVTVGFNFTTDNELNSESALAYPPVEDVKDVAVTLPLGLVGDPQATPHCEIHLLVLGESGSSCPSASRVGVMKFEDAGAGDGPPILIYNMTPEPGFPAEFGINYLHHEVVFYAAVVPSPQGYRLRVTLPRLTTFARLTGAYLTFYGNPSVRDNGATASSAFFTNPSNCSGGPLNATIEADSWEKPGVWASSEATTYTNVVGCDLLSFRPSILFSPENGQAGQPTGYEFGLDVPQETNVAPVLATPDLRDATVTLPSGVSIAPGGASGLEACSEAEIGLSATEEGPDGFQRAAPGRCPPASQIGTARVSTPLLGDDLTGHIYIGQPTCGPCSNTDAADGNLFHGYIEASGDGAIIKIPGKIAADPTTGQLTAMFDDNPQFPFNDLRIRLEGGGRAPLANPRSCGAYTTTASLTSWGSPLTSAAQPATSFNIGSSCSQGFSPSLSAGVTAPQAGASDDLVTRIGRTDADEDLGTVQVTTPPGLLGLVSSVTQCPESDATAGTCPESSRIGHVSVTAGPGPQPLTVPTEGQPPAAVYLTGPYHGSPFGLSFVVPAIAGPFNLGTVIVRAAIAVDPVTGALTVTSDALPTIIDGVPLHVRSVNVTIDRPGFIRNPTNCSVLQVAATVSSVDHVNAGLASPFAVANCANLPFNPSFTASTSGKTSKANGASLRVRIASPGVGQANIAKVDLTIPSILPSRLTTLQKACTEAQFNANPAGCPAASNIATAIVHTPLLNSPLTGPVYFVSHGGAAFPDTEMVLQGEGVTLIVDGHTQITKGVTYSRFDSIPDAPFTSFEFNAPEGRYSIFGANGNLCQTEIRMPTKLIAQNGAVIEQSTVVQPEGCPNAITIVSRSVHKRTITLKVAVPGAGKLTATGARVDKTTKTAKGRTTLTLSLKATGHGKPIARIKLSFTPSKGRRLASSVAVRLKG